MLSNQYEILEASNGIEAMTLLKQERIKYQFFASMSKKIQPEYNSGTDLLTLSE